MVARALKAWMIALMLLCNSCAYMQSHKNVEELGSYYAGHLLDRQRIELVRSGTQWYVGADTARFRLHHPLVYDSVFQETGNHPSFKLIRLGEQKEYHPISSYTANLLQNKTGYFDMAGLAREIAGTPGTWEKLPHGSQRYPILAEIDEEPYQMEEKRVPQHKKIAALALGKIDFIVIDIPGTLAYNVAIPLVAPFVFFYEFSRTD